jgi:hypothetical protein
MPNNLVQRCHENWSYVTTILHPKPMNKDGKTNSIALRGWQVFSPDVPVLGLKHCTYNSH